MIDLILSILPIFYYTIMVIGSIFGLMYAVWRLYDRWRRQSIRESTQEYAINECRIEHGKRPFVFDSKEPHVLTIIEKRERLYLQAIHTPNKQLKRAIQLGVTLINEERKIAKLSSKQRKRKLKLLENKKKEMELLLKNERKELKRRKKHLNKTTTKLEQLKNSE